MKNLQRLENGTGISLLQKKNNPSVSVIIPTYNRANLLIGAVDSILNQTIKDIEIIIVDDGSTDNTQETLARIKDKRLKIYKKTNGGQASALNFGLKHATGKYIAFCDDDDQYLPQKLEKCLDFLESNLKYGVCYSSFYFRSSNGELILKRFNHTDKFFFEQLFSKGFLFINSMLFKRSIIIKAGNFNESITTGNDYDYLLRVAVLTNSFGYVDVPTVIYNRHSLGMTSNKKMMYGVILLLKRNLIRFKSRINPCFYNNIYSTILFREGKYYFWQKQFKKARQLFLKSIRKESKNIRPYIFLPFTFLGLDMFNILIEIYQQITGKFYIRDCS